MRNCILLLTLLLFGCQHSSNHPENRSRPELPLFIDVEQIPATSQGLLQLHNQQRELKGRVGLTIDLYLCDYAQKHAEWMAKNGNLKHSDISKLMGKYYSAGENIAWNQGSEKEVFEAWMHSTGHRENILNRSFTHVGFGVAYDSKNQPYWCACFGG